MRLHSWSFCCKTALGIIWVSYWATSAGERWRLMAYSTTSSFLLRQSRTPMLGFSCGRLRSRSSASKIEGELAQVLGLKAHRLQLERHQTLQVTVVKEQIKFKILIAHLHANLFADKGEAVAELHEEFAQIAQQAGLQIGLAVTLGQVEEIEQVAVLEDAGCVLGQKSRQCCEFLVRQDSSLEGRGFDLAGKFARTPLRFHRQPQIELALFRPFVLPKNHEVVRPWQNSQQCCEFWLIGVNIVELFHSP